MLISLLCMISTFIFDKIAICLFPSFVSVNMIFIQSKQFSWRECKQINMGEFFRGSFTDKLKVDQALLNITSSLERNVWLYQLSDECVSVGHTVFNETKKKHYFKHLRHISVSIQKGGKDPTSKLCRTRNQHRNTTQVVGFYIEHWTVCIRKQVPPFLRLELFWWFECMNLSVHHIVLWSRRI